MSRVTHATFGLWFPFFRWLVLRFPPEWVARLAAATAERAIWAREPVREAILENHAALLGLPPWRREVEESALATLDATIAEHRAALIAAKQRLLELELDTAGDDVDEAQLAASATALADADAARSAAIAAHRDAVGTAARLRGLLAQTDAAYADVAEAAEAAAIVTRLADTVAGRAPMASNQRLSVPTSSSIVVMVSSTASRPCSRSIVPPPSATLSPVSVTPA